MPSPIKKSRYQSRGFTLVELMIAIMILGILVALAIPNMMSVIKRAQNADLVNNANKFQQFLETYTIEAESRGIRSYPTKPSEITIMNFFATQRVKNPFYSAQDTPVTADDAEGTVKFANSSDGQWIVYIPSSKLLFDATLASASIVAPSGQGRGMLVYFPFTGAGQTFPAAATDQINGYQVKTVDSEGKYIVGFTLKGGDPYAF